MVVGGKESGNTQRLAAIVNAVGKKAYHLETEEELDLEALSKMQNIAITAGASTPSWITKRVLRAVQQVPMHRGKGLLSMWMRVERFVLLTNLYVALGAGAVAYAAMLLQGLPTAYPAIAVAVLYVISMHILNHLTGRAESRYNDPERERFYNRYKIPLTTLALSAGALGLVAAYQMGALAFWTRERSSHVRESRPDRSREEHPSHETTMPPRCACTIMVFMIFVGLRIYRRMN